MHEYFSVHCSSSLPNKLGECSLTNCSRRMEFIWSTSHACAQYESWTEAKTMPASRQAEAVMSMWDESSEWMKLGGSAIAWDGLRVKVPCSD